MKLKLAKKIIIFVVILFVMYCFTIFIFKSKFFDEKFNDVLNQYNKDYNIEVVNKDQRYFSAFPTPSFIIKNAEVIYHQEIKNDDKNMKPVTIFNAGDIKISFSLMSIFNKIQTYIYFINGNLRLIDEDINKSLQKTFLNESPQVYEMIFQNNNIILPSGNKLNNANLNLKISDNYFGLNGDFIDNNKIINKINITIDNYKDPIPSNVSITYINDLYNFRITGKKETIGNNINGDLELKTTSNDINIFGKFYSENDKFYAKDVQIKTDNIISGKADLLLNLDDNINIDVNVDIDYLNISNINNEILLKLINRYFLPSETDSKSYLLNTQGRINFNIKDIIFRDNNMGSFKFESDIYDNVLSIYQAKFNITEHDFFNLHGSVTHNDIRSELLGKTQLKISKETFDKINLLLGTDIVKSHAVDFSNDIRVTPGQFNISNLKGNLDQKTSVVANILLSNKKDSYYTEISLDLDKINFDEYIKSGDMFNTYLATLRNFVYNTTKQDTISNFDKLRMLNNIYIIALNFNNFDFAGNHYRNFNSLIELEPASLIVKDINVQSDDFHLKSNISVNAKDLQPNINIDLNADKINGKLLLQPHDDKNIVSDWKENRPLIYNLGEYQGNINLAIDNITFDDQNIKNIKANITIDKNININKFEMKLFDGDVSTRAVISTLGMPTFSTSFVMANIDLGKLSKYFAIDTINGYANISSSFSGSGFNYNDLISKSKGALNLSAAQLKISGFDFNKIIVDLGNARTMIEKQKIIKDATKTGFTIFDKFEGTANIASGYISTEKMNFIHKLGEGFFAGSYNFSNQMLNSVMQMSYKDNSNQSRYFNFTAKGQITDKLEKKYTLQEEK